MSDHPTLSLSTVVLSPCAPLHGTGGVWGGAHCALGVPQWWTQGRNGSGNDSLLTYGLFLAGMEHWWQCRIQTYCRLCGTVITEVNFLQNLGNKLHIAGA